MEIIKTGVRSDLDFSKMSLTEIKDYWESIEGNSLHMVLPSYLNQSYLCEVRDEIKKVKYNKEESEEFQEEELLTLTEREYLPENIKNKKEVAWGAEPGWCCDSWKDITEIGNPFDENIKTEYYSTLEVLQVIDQWIEYLEKFHANKK